MREPQRHVTVRRTAVMVGLWTLLGPASAMAEVGSGDVLAIQNFTQRLLETARTGTTTAWSRRESGSVGQVTVIATDHEPGRAPCRRYQWSIRAEDGGGMIGQGEGCRIGPGNWTLDETRTLRDSARRAAAPDPAPEEPRERRETATRSTRTSPPTPPDSPPETEADAAAPSGETGDDTADETTAAKDPLAELVFTRPPRGAGAAGAE